MAMTLKEWTVMELPSGNTQEAGNFAVGEYASRFPSPCEKFSCDLRERCAAEKMACKAFQKFSTSAYSRTLYPPGEPSREIYEDIYDEDQTSGK
jgi:hypothetical protein